MFSLRARLFLVFGLLVVVALFVPGQTRAQSAGSVQVKTQVPGKGSKIHLELTSVPDEDEQLHQDQVLNLTVTYSSTNEGSVPLTFGVEWEKASLGGNTPPIFEVVEYIPGSASPAYNNAPPIVDLVHRRVYWEIPSFPGDGQEHTVTLRLRTRDLFLGPKPLYFPVRAYGVNPPGITSSQKMYSYRHSQFPGGPKSSAAQLPEAAEVSTTTVLLQQPSNEPDQLRVATSLAALTDPGVQRIATRGAEVRLNQLRSGTQYYLQFANSEVFTVQTAHQPSERIPLPPSLLTIRMQEQPILQSELHFDSSQLHTLVLPSAAMAEIALQTDHSGAVHELELVIQGDGDDIVTRLQKDSPSHYSGTLPTPHRPGRYTLLQRTLDTSGNVSTAALMRLQTYDSLRVTDAHTGAALPQASVVVTMPATAEQVVASSDEQGRVVLPLTSGSYQAEISHPGYVNQYITFTIPPSLTTLPTVALEPDSSQVLYWLQQGVGEWWTQIQTVF